MLRLTGMDVKLEQYKTGERFVRRSPTPAARPRCPALGGPSRCRAGRDRGPSIWLKRVMPGSPTDGRRRSADGRPGVGAGRRARRDRPDADFVRRYRARPRADPRAAAPGARIVTLSVEGSRGRPGRRRRGAAAGWLSADAFDRLLARARLAWVHSASAGVERALTPASRERGVVITNARGVFSRPIAEYVMMMILAVSRKLPGLLELQRERTWQPLEGTELRDVTVGIVGLGSIGRAVGALATAFGCRVVATRRRPESGTAGRADEELSFGEAMLDRVGGPETLPALLAESDFVVLAAPLTPETENMISSRRSRP